MMGNMAENKILKYSDEFWDTSDANNYYAGYLLILKMLDQLKYQGQSVGIIQPVICRDTWLQYIIQVCFQKMQKTGVYY